MLTARDDGRRRAVVGLIGCGQIRRIEPLLKAAETEATAAAGRRALELIGPRRLIDLSCDPAESTRKTAAQALCRISDLQANDDTLAKLTAQGTVAAKTATLNLLCRPWPQACGVFHVVIGEERSPFLVHVTQVGRFFYLSTESTEFTTVPGRLRCFEMPIERWCAATGAAVDVTALRQMITGSLVLTSPLGGRMGRNDPASRQADTHRPLARLSAF